MLFISSEVEPQRRARFLSDFPSPTATLKFGYFQHLVIVDALEFRVSTHERLGDTPINGYFTEKSNTISKQ